TGRRATVRDRGFLGSECGSHASWRQGAGFLRSAPARLDEPQPGLELEAVSRTQGCVFAETVARDERRVVAKIIALPSRREVRQARHVHRGLRVRRVAELFR